MNCELEIKKLSLGCLFSQLTANSLQLPMLSLLEITNQIRLAKLFAFNLHPVNRKQKYYSKLHIASSLFMILSLVWLTVSIPYVNASQQVKKETEKKSSRCSDTNNPFSNTTEEKNESSVNTLSEYLHDRQQEEPLTLIIPKYYKCHP